MPPWLKGRSNGHVEKDICFLEHIACWSALLGSKRAGIKAHRKPRARAVLGRAFLGTSGKLNFLLSFFQSTLLEIGVITWW